MHSPFHTIPFRSLQKLAVSFSSFGVLSHSSGANDRCAVIERLRFFHWTGHFSIIILQGAVKKVPKKRQAVPKGAACKIFVEKGLVQWKNQPFGGIMDL